MYGTKGFISFADYIHGNQDAIQRSLSEVGANALKPLNEAVTASHASSDAAAGGVPDELRAEMNAQQGIDTADAYRRQQDYEATKAAHPNEPWVTAPGTETQGHPQDGSTPWGVYGVNQTLHDSNGNPLAAAQTGQFDVSKLQVGSNPTDPYSIQNVRSGLASTEAGRKAENDLSALQPKANEVANLDNWGGVFDAYRQRGSSSRGAAFNANLAGTGLHGVAEQGKAAVKGAGNYYENAIRGGFGQMDTGTKGYAGHDVWTNQLPGEQKPVWAYESDGNGGQTPYNANDPAEQAKRKNTTSPTLPGTGGGGATDDSGANRGGATPGTPNPDYIPPQQDPNDPWGYYTQGGG